MNELLAKVKGLNPGVLTVVGGHHATIMPQDFVSPSVDLIVRGEGVGALREIVERCERGIGYEGIPGVALAEKDAALKVEPEAASDLDGSPFPLRTLTVPYRKDYYSEWMPFPLQLLRTVEDLGGQIPDPKAGGGSQRTR